MKHVFFLWIAAACISFSLQGRVGVAQSPAHPFPNHTEYAAHIRPSGYTQEQLDAQAAAYYDAWKKIYLRNDCDDTSQYYVYFGDEAINVSEGTGYGMMIVVMMAGYDPDAHRIFDGLYRFSRAHPSRLNPRLMDWQQVTCHDPPSGDDDAATDGDLDIAMALLMAHEQWGSDGGIDYLEEARALLAAIAGDEIHPVACTPLLGDWCDPSSPGYYHALRTSDIMPGHFRLFFRFTGDTLWQRVADSSLALLERVQHAYAPVTGLVPDFITGLDGAPAPAAPGFLEGDHDGDYYYNACRVPWRLGVAWLMTGDAQARRIALSLTAGVRERCGGEVTRLSSGYRLDGTPLYDWHDAAFSAPLAVGAMLDTLHPGWLDALYDDITKENALDEYYSATLSMLALLVLSGNAWAPAAELPAARLPLTASSSALKIWPTVTRGPLTILTDDGENSHRTLAITTLTGQTLLERKMNGARWKLDLSSWSSGIYLVVLRDGPHLTVRKVVKE